MKNIKKQLRTGSNIELLFYMIRENNVDEVRKLIENGVNINERYCLTRTALMTACNLGNIEIVKILIEVFNSFK